MYIKNYWEMVNLNVWLRIAAELALYGFLWQIIDPLPKDKDLRYIYLHGGYGFGYIYYGIHTIAITTIIILCLIDDMIW